MHLLFEIWEALNQIYTSSSLAKITQLRAKLQNLRKNGLTTMEYVQKHKNICNTLAAVGKLVSHKDYLLYLFGGLDCEYNAFVTSITNRHDNPFLEKIYSLLLSYEFRLESQNASAQLSSLQANLAHLKTNKKPYRPNFSNPAGPLHPKISKIELSNSNLIHQTPTNFNPVYLANPRANS
ncbi:hypothetical protein PanWU01x14_366110 [Parasponia andersonii]|uniref:Retrotransposon gag domain-containing protein n=1 Tax=Parasponia andersonii TaxID=3476 RepID=A0A2P5A5S5_PARAD|nr:hypothetical protein PanWU01x14_366110 [Parasponia andersonii]